MPEFSLIGWISLIGAVLLFGSLFVAQAADSFRSKVLFNVANAMTLVGALGLLIGLVGWLFG